MNLAESRAEDRIPMGMKDWKELLDDYLKLRRLPILVGKGKISAEEAREHVLEKYEKFRVNFFETILKAENFSPAEAFFTDDKIENCEAAAKLGIKVHHFISEEKLFEDWSKYI